MDILPWVLLHHCVIDAMSKKDKTVSRNANLDRVRSLCSCTLPRWGVALSIPFGIKFKVESVGLTTPLLFESLSMTWDILDLQDTLAFSCNRLTY